MLSVNKGRDWQALLKYFQDETHYKLFTDKLNAADFGIPQIRQRIFIVGFRMPETEFKFPRRTHQNKEGTGQLQLDFSDEDALPWVPARYALQDIENLPTIEFAPMAMG